MECMPDDSRHYIAFELLMYLQPRFCGLNKNESLIEILATNGLTLCNESLFERTESRIITNKSNLVALSASLIN
jgi:hypothetical protein